MDKHKQRLAELAVWFDNNSRDDCGIIDQAQQEASQYLRLTIKLLDEHEAAADGFIDFLEDDLDADKKGMDWCNAYDASKAALDSMEEG